MSLRTTLAALTTLPLLLAPACMAENTPGTTTPVDATSLADLLGQDSAVEPTDTATAPEDTTAPPADTAVTQDSVTPLQDTAVAQDTAVEQDTSVAQDTSEPLPLFSFFVTSLEAMQELSGSANGFGGDLRFGESTGLAGADKICATIAEMELPGAGAKGWRAFLSARTGGADGGQVHAIERIGSGPWYDRLGRLVAPDIAGLTGTRPAADAAIKNDLPNERGESQKNQPGPNSTGLADNHDIVTGSTSTGRYSGAAAGDTCNDWTSTTATGSIVVGHSWPAQSGQSWIKAHTEKGCAAVVNLVQNGPGSPGCKGLGCGGGYGGIYCFALTP